MTDSFLPRHQAQAGALSLRQKLAAGFVLLGCAILPSVALAQPAGTDKEDFLYYVRKDDTLGDLASTYLLDVGRWKALAEFNRIADEFRLPIGKQLRIPLSWIPRLPATAVLEYVQGTVLVNGAPASNGQALATGQRLETTAGSAAAIRLPDGGFVALPEDSQLNVELLQQFAGTGLIDSVVALEQGDLETEVSPQHEGVGRFEVRTPVTITGVRGTRFRVRVDESGTINEVLDGQVQLASGPSTTQADTSRRVAAGYGTRVSADGSSHPIVALPAAPAILSSQPEGGQWTVDFAPVPGAVSYLVQYSHDAQGSQIIERQTLAAPPLQARLTEPRYYASIIAVDAQGLRSPASRAVALTGFNNALISSDGAPVLSGTGAVVVLQVYH
ncbi:FecR family protein [Kerstersia gyiorum]|uniref:FecR family protein n=1 Tax=Kerstersia gyiorum TaxID=206506 RepID=A0A4Q7MQH9_9BURK|nr:FecR domain-containing protein [Kerstersia gyiorum]KAB0543621.1 LysM peptidoglycan-binding domain-containing protein [Kerstersia gyiorum]MCR4159866.1 FecR domain-containing protein [Kerstersia gyiorum]QBR40221.1 LysM peptidoglycan-binding domain-containing protein [Kerstersia gyiorum]RZS70031.1 FecR family protein [Kerstersia gyiorum]